MPLIYEPEQEPGPKLQAAIEAAVSAAGMELSRDSTLIYHPDGPGSLTWVQKMFWPEEWDAIDHVRAQKILAALKLGARLPVIDVIERPIGEPKEDPLLGQEVGFQVIDDEGFHLYHLARAVGVTHVYTRWMEPYYDRANPSAFSYRPQGRLPRRKPRR